MKLSNRTLGQSAIGCIVLIIVLGTVVGVAGAALGAWVALSPFDNPITNRFFDDFDLSGAQVDTREVPGNARAFDPFAAYPVILDYAGEGAALVKIDVSLVRADGTLDLKAVYAPKPDVTYTFAREVERPADAAPPGAGGANTGPWHELIEVRAYEPGQRRRRTTTTQKSATTVQYTNKGMERTVAEPSAAKVTFVPAPACSIATFWEVALARGAPRDAVARITYDADGYKFSISGLRISLRFDTACALRE